MTVKIYTRRGDDGRACAVSGERLEKNDPYFEAQGAVDELNAVLGIARVGAGALDVLLERLQLELCELGATLCGARPFAVEHTSALERDIDAIAAKLPKLRSFILPGGTSPASALHHARTVCRRAERRVVALAPAVSPDVLAYMNRLGDLLFVLARYANHMAAEPERPWPGVNAT